MHWCQLIVDVIFIGEFFSFVLFALSTHTKNDVVNWNANIGHCHCYIFGHLISLFYHSAACLSTPYFHVHIVHNSISEHHSLHFHHSQSVKFTEEKHIHLPMFWPTLYAFHHFFIILKYINIKNISPDSSVSISLPSIVVKSIPAETKTDRSYYENKAKKKSISLFNQNLSLSSICLPISLRIEFSSFSIVTSFCF